MHVLCLWANGCEGEDIPLLWGHWGSARGDPISPFWPCSWLISSHFACFFTLFLHSDFSQCTDRSVADPGWQPHRVCSGDTCVPKMLLNQHPPRSRVFSCLGKCCFQGKL